MVVKVKNKSTGKIVQEIVELDPHFCLSVYISTRSNYSEFDYNVYVEGATATDLDFIKEHRQKIILNESINIEKVFV